MTAITLEEAQRVVLACDAGLRYEPESRRDPFDTWMALMEAVEALCPRWPEREYRMAGEFNL